LLEKTWKFASNRNYSYHCFTLRQNLNKPIKINRTLLQQWLSFCSQVHLTNADWGICGISEASTCKLRLKILRKGNQVHLDINIHRHWFYYSLTKSFFIQRGFNGGKKYIFSMKNSSKNQLMTFYFPFSNQPHSQQPVLCSFVLLR